MKYYYNSPKIVGCNYLQSQKDHQKMKAAESLGVIGIRSQPPEYMEIKACFPYLLSPGSCPW